MCRKVFWFTRLCGHLIYWTYRSSIVTIYLNCAKNPVVRSEKNGKYPISTLVPVDSKKSMPNGGSDCCGTCWYNRSLEGERGNSNFNPEIPSYCEIRDLDIEDPFYTYCANHPYHGPNRDPIPIGPVFIGMPRAVWKESPDTEEIRQHLLHIVRSPQEHAYLFPTISARDRAIQQLLEWRDTRLIPALEELSEKRKTAEESERLKEIIRVVKEHLDDGSEP